ncbi:hypothetical protein FRC07_001883 [Ceratobasidium sp. 392]|nr:hypothetical protein FRC07_001883 [Ceratobasidium sp. 392]
MTSSTTTRACPACLTLPELLSIVSESLVTPDLLSLALSSHQHFTILAPALWGRRGDVLLQDLVKVLMDPATPLKRKGNVALLPLDASNTADEQRRNRFDLYASGIRNLTLQNIFTDDVERCVLTGISKTRGLKCPLPRLRGLTINWSEEQPAMCYALRDLLPMLDAPSCSSIRIVSQTYELSLSSDGGTRGELEFYGSDCDDLYDLWEVLAAVLDRFHISSDFDELPEKVSVSYGFPASVSNLSSLRCLNRLVLTLALLRRAEILATVGYLPNLRLLVVLDSRQGGDLDNSMRSLQVPRGAFPRLAELEIYAKEGLRPMVRLLQLLAGRVETLTISCPAMDPVLSSVFEGLGKNAARLKDLTFNATDAELNTIMSGTLLSPLTEIKLSDLAITGTHVDLPELLEQPCMAWCSSLRYLELGTGQVVSAADLREFARFTSLGSVVVPVASTNKPLAESATPVS